MYPYMYPNMYNPAARHGLYGTHESPSGTILKKDLEIQGLFFRLQKSERCHTAPSNRKSQHGIVTGDCRPFLSEIGL